MRVTVDRCGGGEDNGPTIGLIHRFEEADGTFDISPIIAKWLFLGFANGLQTGTMNDDFGLKPRQRASQLGLIAYIFFKQIKAFASEILDMVKAVWRAVLKIVDNKNVVICVQQPNQNVTANITGAARKT